MPPIYVPPGGWCLTPQTNPFGIGALALLQPHAPLYTFLAYTLATLLGSQGVTEAKAIAALEGQRNVMYPTLSSGALELVELWTALWGPGTYVMDATLTATLATLGLAARIRSDYLPAAEAFNLGVTQDYFNQAIAHADQNLNTALATSAAESQAVASYAQSLAQAEQAFAADLYRAATAYADQVATDAATQVSQQANARITVAEQYTTSAVQEAIAYTTAQANQLRAELVTVEGWAATSIDQTRADALTEARQAEANAITYTNATTEAALAPVWAGTAASVNTTTEQLATQHPTEAKTLNLVTTAVPATPALALAGLAASVKTLAKTATDCALPYCTEKNKLGKQSHTLGSLLTGGLLAAFVVEMIDHPDTAAHDVATVAHDLAAPVYDAVHALVH